MSRMIRISFAVAAAFAFALPLSAQQFHPGTGGSWAEAATSTQAAAVTAAPGDLPPSGRSTMASAIFTPAPLRTGLVPTPTALREPSNQNIALMVVGVAGLVVGAVIGDDEGTIVMLAGGGIGLLGLYRYLR